MTPTEVAAKARRSIAVYDPGLPANVVACPAAGSTWWWWWSPRIGPAPVVALAYLHHLAAVGRTRVDFVDLARASGIGPRAVWRPDHPLAITLARLADVHLLALDAAGAVAIPDPIYRPGPTGRQAAASSQPQPQQGTTDDT